MKTLHLYLLRQILASALLTVAVFTFVLLLMNLMRDILPLLVSGQVSLALVVQAVALLLPWVWVFALPMGLLTATLLVFGRFSADQELTAARAGGISLIALVMPVLLLSLVACGLSAWFNLQLGPSSRVTYKQLRGQFFTDLNPTNLPAGQPMYFTSDESAWGGAGKSSSEVTATILVEGNDEGNLREVTIDYQSGTTGEVRRAHAPTGRVHKDLYEGTNYLVFDLYEPRIVVIRAHRSVFITGAPFVSYPIPLDTGNHRRVTQSISDLTFAELQTRYRESLAELAATNAPDPGTNSPATAQAVQQALRKTKLQENAQLRAQMNWQASFSFACFSFTMIGIPLGIRVHRRETNIGIVLALALVAIYYAFILLAQALSGRPGAHAELIFWVPNFLFQAIGAVLLWRANRGI